MTLKQPIVGSFFHYTIYCGYYLLDRLFSGLIFHLVVYDCYQADSPKFIKIISKPWTGLYHKMASQGDLVCGSR